VSIIKKSSVSRVSILLTILSLALWSYSLTQAKLDLGPYGFIHSLPILFFISLGLLTIASAILWASKEIHGELLLLQLILLITSLWLTPLLIGGIGNSQPRFNGAFKEFGMSEYIISQGHFSPEVAWKFSYPGVYILGAVIANILGISQPDVMLAVIPFLAQLFFLPFLYLIFKNTLGEGQSNYHWAATWVFYLGISITWCIFHTQTLANLLLLVILVIFTRASDWLQEKHAFPGRFNSILLFASLTITHLFTSFFALVTTTALYIAKNVKLFTFIILVGTFLVAWLLYGTASFFEWRLPDFANQFLRLDVLWDSSVINRLAGNPAHQQVVQIRLVTFALFCLMGLAGFILSVRKRTMNDTTMIVIASSALFLAISIGTAYGFETPQRVSFFLMVPIAYFATKMLNYRGTAIILVLLWIIALPLHFISYYGNQAEDYRSPDTIASWHFFHEHTGESSVVGGFPFGVMKKIEQYRYIDLDQLYEGKYSLDRLPNYYPQYICLTQSDQEHFAIIYDNPIYIPEMRASLSNAANFDVVYVNPDVAIYVSERQEK